MSNQSFENLETDQAAKLLAQAIAQTNLVDSETINSELLTWRKSGSRQSFGDHLLDSRKLTEVELETIETIVRFQLDRVANRMGASSTEEMLATNPTESRGLASDLVSDEKNRFQVSSSHREGGLGEVLVAEDNQFRRRVAVKRIKRTHQNKKSVYDRFMVEAQLTGRLEHPGVVPVYGLGTTGEGSPFYAMKFVDGLSLADALQKFHAEDSTSFQSITFRKLIQRLVSVAYTLHYCHSQGVIHRDIKPDNIMLGEFDETLVVDWGIARLMNSKADDEAIEMDSKPANCPSKTLAGPSTKTEFGQVVGTPGYMSSEQALGWHDSLDSSSDVFSLGATLYTVLTNERPFEDPNLDLLLQNTITGKLASPRSLNPKIPKPLEAVCLKAMSNKKSARYKNAKQMALDLESYLGGEPVTAWQEPWSVRSRRWIRKHLNALIVGTIGLAVLATSGAVASTWLATANSKERLARQRATENLDVAKQVIDDFLVKLASDTGEGDITPLTRELFQKAADYQKNLQIGGNADPQLLLDRGNTHFLIGTVARRFGEVDQSIEAYETCDSLLKLLTEKPSNNLYDEAVSLRTSNVIQWVAILADNQRNEPALEAIERGLALVDRCIAEGDDVATALSNRAELLKRKEACLANLGQFNQRQEIRKSYWRTVDEFFDFESQASPIERRNIIQRIVNTQPLTDQEQLELSSRIERCLPWCESAFSLGENETGIPARNTRAGNGMILAKAYAKLGRLADSARVAQQAANIYWGITEDQPKIAEYKVLGLKAYYLGLVSTHNQSLRTAPTETNIQEDLSSLQVTYQQAKEAFDQLALDNGSQPETELIFLHSSALVANRLARAKNSAAVKAYECCLRLVPRVRKQEHSQAKEICDQAVIDAGSFYSQIGKYAKAKQLLSGLVADLEQLADQRPDEFANWIRLSELYFVMWGNDFRQTQAAGIRQDLSLLTKSAGVWNRVPESLQKDHSERVLGLRVRSQHRLLQTHLASKDQQAAASCLRRVHSLLMTRRDSQRPKISAPETCNDIVRFFGTANPHFVPLDDKGRIRESLTFILESVDTLPRERVKLLADRAKCHALLGDVRSAHSDHQDADQLAHTTNDLGNDIQLDLAIAALMIAEAGQEKLVAKEFDQSETIQSLDDYAAKTILDQYRLGIFQFEIAREMLRPIKQLDRLRNKKELEGLFADLPKKGADHRAPSTQ